MNLWQNFTDFCNSTLEMLNSALGIPLAFLAVYMVKSVAAKEARLVALDQHS